MEDTSNTGGCEGCGRVAPDTPTLRELEALHGSLDAEEREELLECLLIAASKGAETMMLALCPWLLAAATRELLGEGAPRDQGFEIRGGQKE